jgi:hypothetical protein
MTASTSERLDAIEAEQRRQHKAIAQLASAARIGFGWKPSANNQVELQEILSEAQDEVQRERVSA